MQLVDRLVLVSPLQVKLDLSDQWEAVGVCYVQFLHSVYAIFLQKKQQTNVLKILHDFNIYSEYIRVIKVNCVIFRCLRKFYTLLQ